MSEQQIEQGRRKSVIPTFQSLEEEAEWWDTHDTGATEYEGEFQPVKVRVTHGLSENVQVRFDAKVNRELERYAKERGVKKSTLIRMWVLERLHEEEQHSPTR
ncbi:MAG TPA: CopG family antitoxin [Ktedonobacterales bacterium]|jgi:hypothetical protein